MSLIHSMRYRNPTEYIRKKIGKTGGKDLANSILQQPAAAGLIPYSPSLLQNIYSFLPDYAKALQFACKLLVYNKCIRNQAGKGGTYSIKGRTNVQS